MKLHEVKIIRSRRRTLSVEVELNGEILVRAPERVSEKRIADFLHEKRSWIERTVRKQRELFQHIPKRTFAHGEHILYLGERYRIEHVETGQKALHFDEAFYLSVEARARAKTIFERWYKTRARFVFNERSRHYSQYMRVPYGSIRLSSAKTRWGSCGAGNSLNFNWRLVMAPLPVIDSVVIHELAHCRHKNHSKQFWNFVHAHCPDYKAQKEWLKENHLHLEWD